MLIAARPALFPVLFTLAVAASACQTRTAPPAAAAQTPTSPDVWAVVDGREIRRADVEKAFRRTVQPNPAMSEDEATAAKLNVLDQMIAEDIMLAKGNELKIVVPDTEIDAAYNDGKKNIPDDAFNKALTARNLTPADMRDALRRELIAQKVIEREVTSKVTVTDQEVTDFFQANKAQFNVAEESFHLAQIVVTPGRDAGLNNRTGDDAATPQAATAKVQMLMERLKSGVRFNDLAMDYSEEPRSTPQGGDVGLVSISALRQAPAPLRDAVLKLQPGAVSVVTMEGGYTIVALVEKQAPGQRDLSMPDVRNGIMATLRGRREQLLRTAYVEAVRSKATVMNLIAQRIVDAQGKLPPSLPLSAPK